MFYTGTGVIHYYFVVTLKNIPMTRKFTIDLVFDKKPDCTDFTLTDNTFTMRLFD